MSGHPAADIKMCWCPMLVLWDGQFLAVWYVGRLLGENFNFRDIFINKNIGDGKIPAISGVPQLILNLPANGSYL